MHSNRASATAIAQSSIAISWLIPTLLAAVFLMVTMGTRATLGLFISPLNSATGLGIVSISLAMGIGQLALGITQPIAGAVADRYGPGRVLATAVLLLSAGMALMPLINSPWSLYLVLGVIVAAGAGAGFLGVLLSAVSPYLPAEKRGMASGTINAGASVGQVIFAPLAQKLTSVFGWMGSLWTLAVLILLILPISWFLRRTPQAAAAANKTVGGGVRGAVRDAFKDRSYVVLQIGFFACGFHVAFLLTHLPGEIALCGQPAAVAGWALGLVGMANIVGSLTVGRAMDRFRCKNILFWLYFPRAAMIVIYVFSPKTELTIYLFAFGMGLTFLSVLPPTAGVVGKLFGVRYLATLFGVAILLHQVGGFFGAWLGGLAVANSGSYLWMWYADAMLSLAAAFINLSIREPVVQPAAAR